MILAYLRGLYIFPLARGRLVCRLIGHRTLVNIAVFNLRNGRGRADTCPRCGLSRNYVWERP